ncbi:MAG: hypothetical protein NVS4B7_15660 [Ktedonobacteraceae bacterium]
MTNTHVGLENAMESMDMGTDKADASFQSDGTYLAHVQFSMSGLWQFRVDIAIPELKLVVLCLK